MRHLGRALVVSALISLVATSAASANGFAYNGIGKCGGTLFATCAAVTVTTTYNSTTGNTVVVMQVTNLSGTNGTQNSIFTQIGLWNMAAFVPAKGNNPAIPGAAYVNGSLQVLDNNSADVSSNWQLGTSGLSGSGIQPGIFGVDPLNGINSGIGAGQTFTFTFELSGLASSFDVNTAGFALHGQGGVTGCSTKLVIQPDGTPNAGPYNPECTPITSTPEPVTMTLLATGLLAMGGAGVLRRRRNQIS